MNPQSFAFVDRVECIAGPRGRFLYLIDHNDATSRARVRSFVVGSDGIPVLASTFTRGRISDLQITPNGRNAYLAETLGTGYVVRAMRIDPQTGAFDFQINETATPCSTLDPNPPRIFLHPDGRAAFVAVADSTPAVRLGSYQILSDGSLFGNSQCLGFETLADLSFDPRGDVIYITGRDGSGQDGVLRYAIEPVTAELTLLGTQTVAATLSNIASQSEPGMSTSDPDKYTVFLARDDLLIPHVRGVGAVLVPVMTSQGATPSLPYGSSGSVRTVQTTVRGTAATTSAAAND
jgi:6-phosphogluconolactonase (cycloisomerase 2 family)